MNAAGWWTALGVAFAAVELAALLVDRATAIARKDLGKRSMKLAYVRTAPGLGGGLAAGRTVLMARVFPLMALVGLALAFLSTVALTVFPEYRSLAEGRDVYHGLATSFCTGLAAAYFVTLVMLVGYFRARRRVSAESPPEETRPAA